jgi:WS/DGAT/MGAT family acyltransferase
MWRGVWRAASFQKPVEPPVPETRFNGPVSPERVMDTVSIPMDRLRAIREAVPGATVNDVLLAVCGGALRRWLGRRGELPQEPLVAMVPVNARAGHEEDLPGNHLSMRFLPIGTHLPDPLERLEAVHRASLHAKSGEAGLDARQASAIARHVPALPLAGVARLVTGLGLGYRALRLCNCTITNVPANRPGLRLGPARLVQVSGIGPIIDGMGLLISIFSYAGMANLSFTSCPQMLPDPETLARDTERELRRLERAMERAA